jgi:Ca-activated chloride channel family protein
MLMDKTVKNLTENIEDSSENLKFAAAVAEFGMILRESEFRGNATLESAANLAASAKGDDEDGYRSEMIRLINTALDMRLLSDRTGDK